MLSVGASFPAFELTAVVDLDLKNAFKPITETSYKGKWKVYFFWPKDFTFVCPTEIAAFGELNSEFKSRDAQVLGGSIDSEFVHWAWRNEQPSLKNLPFPMLSDIKRELTGALGILDPNAGVAQRSLPQRRRIHAQLDEAADLFQRVAKNEARAFQGAEEIACHRKAAAAHAREIERRPAGTKHPALDLGHLKLGIDLALDADQTAIALERVNTLAGGGVAHPFCRLAGLVHAAAALAAVAA